MINQVYFFIISILYVTSLAFIDGIFNRLVFREYAHLPYKSEIKKQIYKRWEWTIVGMLLLIMLPLVIPFIISYFLGGWYYVRLYFMALLMVPWDIIFGKLVFDDWFGDSPSIALPVIGWVNLPLSLVYTIRLILFILLVVIK